MNVKTPVPGRPPLESLPPLPPAAHRAVVLTDHIGDCSAASTLDGLPASCPGPNSCDYCEERPALLLLA